MIRHLTLSTALLALVAPAAFAQTTIVREAAPVKAQSGAHIIVANSDEDIALQKEIEKIRAYNAYVESQVGISDTWTEGQEPVRQERAVPAPSFAGAQVELFPVSPSTTTIKYATANGQTVSITPTVSEVIAAPSVSTHRIAAGDTLYSLAKSRCLAVSDIQSANNMSDANIRLGQVLTLPASKCASTVIAAHSEVRAETPVVRRVLPVQTGLEVHTGAKYAVLPKDTLYSIGKRYCVKAEDLADFNGFTVNTAIRPGQMLNLPKNACVK